MKNEAKRNNPDEDKKITLLKINKNEKSKLQSNKCAHNLIVVERENDYYYYHNLPILPFIQAFYHFLMRCGKLLSVLSFSFSFSWISCITSIGAHENCKRNMNITLPSVRFIWFLLVYSNTWRKKSYCKLLYGTNVAEWRNVKVPHHSYGDVLIICSDGLVIMFRREFCPAISINRILIQFYVRFKYSYLHVSIE